MTPLRVGIAGAGYVTPFHIEGWRKTGQARVKAIYARDRRQGEEKARTLDVPAVFSDFRRFLDESGIDIVDIITPPEAHLSMVMEAAERGIHIICQKPLAPSLEEAEKIINIAQEAGVRFMVHENWRFRSWYRVLGKLLREGILGQIFYAHFCARFAGTVLSQEYPDVPYSLRRQPFFADMSPFLVFESVIHHLDVSRYLFGEPISVYARLHRVSELIKGEDLATVVLGYPHLTSVIERSYGSKGHTSPPLQSEQVVIEGKHGTAFIEMDGRLRLVLDGPQGRREIQPDYPLENAYANSYAATIAHFVEKLLAQEPFETEGEDNLRTLALVFAAYRSAEANQVVTLSAPHYTSPALRGGHERQMGA